MLQSLSPRLVFFGLAAMAVIAMLFARVYLEQILGLPPCPLCMAQRVFVVLDWRHGNFEFASCTVSGEDALGESTTTLLLEHARVSGERARSTPSG